MQSTTVLSGLIPSPLSGVQDSDNSQQGSNAAYNLLNNNYVQAARYHLPIWKQAVKRKKRFYEKMKNRSEFSDTDNFRTFSDKQRKQLSWLHDNLENMERVSAYSMFAKSSDWSHVSSAFRECDPTIDVLKLIEKNIIDLSLTEMDENKITMNI